ncbi:helix-turn-helix domain-containing protein [Streptosporangium sp. V21-05]|uniref:helix-turn-helix domain-containing protein n=1 Tax=Streptosporangium sp. V21-05 TaxID=3446115 RepID=UPI003F53D7FE
MKSPTVRHRRLGRELRRLRERAGLSVPEVARRLGWSASKAHRIEAGRIMVSEADLADACDLFGADSATTASLIQLGKDAGRRGWWTAYSDVFTGSYISMEAEASTILKWEQRAIPGLLQSEDYAHGVIKATLPNLSEAELRRRVDARMVRKVSLVGPNAPKLHVLMDEAVLRRPIGSPGVMAHQFDDLLRVMEWSHITVQVLPFSTGAHVGMEGGFSVLSFDAEDPAVGYTEGPAGEVYIEAAGQVRNLMLTFERLVDVCLSPEKSAVLIAAARSHHDLP